MQPLDIHASSALIGETERGIPELHARIDRQRQLVEALAFEGKDLASATIILDSLLTSLFLCVEDRQRLRTKRDVREAHAA